MTRIKLFHKTTDADLSTGLQVAYRDTYGEYSFIGTITDIEKYEGYTLYRVDGLLYAADELKLLYVENLKTEQINEQHTLSMGVNKYGEDVLILTRTHYLDQGKHLVELHEPDELKTWYLAKENPAPEDISREIELNDWSRWNQQPLTPDQKIEISEAIYDQLLNCLPPHKWNGSYFEVGEPDHHDNKGRAIHRACWKENGKYFTGYPKNIADKQQTIIL